MNTKINFKKIKTQSVRKSLKSVLITTFILAIIFSGFSDKKNSIVNSIGQKFTLIPGGSFIMGESNQMNSALHPIWEVGIMMNIRFTQ